ncbi:YhcU family protein [Cytobacillus gottheilii]|uniref:YhcU family protein n=1 Tax=Cytobacillus gottheilii TaxID=859144 RepID=A0ABX8FFA3_9BACI|nr:YhcU family protein [Cytobacillus gottheilii]QVY62718.1 YhcU family protein [Cytobacillus gottheilii]
MKVVFASTPDQEQRIARLIQKFYADIFPKYFTDEEIKEFESLKVLHTSTRHFEYFGTLREAYQVICGLETIYSILEMAEIDEKYEDMFSRNVEILERFELSFPFHFSQFSHEKEANTDTRFSVYTKAANEWLV